MIEGGYSVRAFYLFVVGITAIVVITPRTSSAQGVIISAGGPVHRAMGGASTAAPTSAISALYWNPATISGLEHSELEVGFDVLFTEHSVASSIVTVDSSISGHTDADPGTFLVPNVGWTYRLRQHPSLTFGLGVNAVAGFKTNLRADPSNPVLSPPPFGLGNVSSEASFISLTPVLACAVSDQLSLAVGPVITTGQVGIEPFIFNPPNADGQYASGQASRYHWGGGVQAGVYYIHNCDWHLGASIKSPSWMETFEFYSVDENGLPRLLRTEIDLPMIVSIGASYSGFENWLFALDARYFDYENTKGFGEPAAFDSTAAVPGLDWSSVMAVALGVQRKLGEKVYLRVGYTYNQSPIRESESFFNTASILCYEHTLSCGMSYQLSEQLALNLGYSHYFENSRTGPISLPGVGVVPGSSITNASSADFLSFGVIMRM